MFVLSILEQSQGVPRLLRSNTGMARRRDDGAYEYLCPASWSGSESFLATAAQEARRVLVATSSGVAAGMDLAVWLASDLLGGGAGEEAARRCEYAPSTDPDSDPFALP